MKKYLIVYYQNKEHKIFNTTIEAEDYQDAIDVFDYLVSKTVEKPTIVNIIDISKSKRFKFSYFSLKLREKLGGRRLHREITKVSRIA